MTATDESQFYAALRKKGRGVFADATAEMIGLCWNRAEYLLHKWARAGWWEYGVSLRSGWLTDEAPAELPTK